MRHLNRGRKLGRNSPHRRALKSNILQSLFRYGQIVTTIAKAKEYAPHAEKLITLAKRAEVKVKEFLDKTKAAGETNRPQKEIDRECDAIRMAYANRAFRVLKNKKLVYRLFKIVTPLYAERKGGYTQVFRIDKLRAGDKAQLAVFKLIGEIPKMEEQVKAKKVLTSEEKAANKQKEKERKEKDRQKEKERKEKEKLKKDKEKAKKAKKAKQ